MQWPTLTAAALVAFVATSCVSDGPAGPDDSRGVGDLIIPSAAVDSATPAIDAGAADEPVESAGDVPRPFSDVREFSDLVGVGKTRETLVMGLDGQLRVYRDEAFEEELANYGGKPRSILHYQKGDAGSPDWLDNYKKISVLGATGPKLRVSVDGQEGWIARNSVKFDHAPFIVTEDGRYVADVFTDRLRYKGNRVYSWFIEENRTPVLVVRLADPESSPDDVRYLKYKFDPSRKRFTDVRVSKTPVPMEKSTTVWDMLDQEKQKNFVAETGYRNPLPPQDDDGMLLVEEAPDDLPLDPDASAVKIGKYIYVNF